MSLYEMLRSRWLETGICINAGVKPATLAEFEEKHNVLLPNSFKDYLLIANGMEEGQVDEYLISFLSLEAIDRSANYKEISVNEVGIIVAEYSIYSHFYQIRATRCGSSSHVLVSDGENEKEIATSFDSFVRQYLSDPVGVANCW